MFLALQWLHLKKVEDVLVAYDNAQYVAANIWLQLTSLFTVQQA